MKRNSVLQKRLSIKRRWNTEVGADKAFSRRLSGRSDSAFRFDEPVFSVGAARI